MLIFLSLYFVPIIVVEVYFFIRNRRSTSYLFRWVTQEVRK